MSELEKLSEIDEFINIGHEGDLSFLNKDELKQIQDLYGDELNMDSLQEFSWNYMPDDMKAIIIKSKKKSIGHVDYMTKVKGDVCFHCGSELIEIADNVFDCSLAYKDSKEGRSVFTNCRSIKNTTKIDIDKNRELLANMTNKRVYPCRNNDIKQVRGMLLANNDRLVTAPNFQFTEVTIETKVTFEEKIDKKLGKPIPPVMICSNLVDEFIEKLPENYKVFKVEDVGFGLFKWGCDCEKDHFGGELIQYGGTCTQEQLWEKQNEVHWFEVHMQRIDSVVEEKMLKFFDQARFGELRIRPYLVAEIYLYFVARFDTNGKRFVVNRAKKLAKEGKIEVVVEKFEFSDYRYDRNHKNQDVFVGGANTLNTYRARNDNVVRLEEEFFKDLKDTVSEIRNSYGEEKEIAIKHKKDLWAKINKQHKVYVNKDNGEGIYVSMYDGELLFYSNIPDMKGKSCKCGLSRKRCNLKNKICVFDGFKYPQNSWYKGHDIQ